MSRLPGPLDPTRDSFELAAKERVRQGFAEQFRLNLPPEALLPPTAAVKPLGVFLPPQLPRDLRDLSLDQRGRGPLGAQQLQPVQLWILNPVTQIVIQVWIGPAAAPAGFLPMPQEQAARLVAAYDVEKAKLNQTPSQPSTPQPPTPAQPASERKVSVKVTAASEFAVTRKPDGKKEQSLEVSGGIECTWEIIDGSKGSVEFTQKTELALKAERGESGPWEPKLPEFKLGAELAAGTAEIEIFRVKWKAVVAAEAYVGVGYRTGVVGGGIGLGVEANLGKKRSLKIEFKAGREYNEARGDPPFGPSDSLGGGVSATVFAW